MSKLTTKAVAKVAAVATGLGMATSLLSLAPMAHAATLTSSQIDSIVTLLESFGASTATVDNVRDALNGKATSGSTSTSVSASCTFTMSLHVGSSGTQVTCLQNGLIDAGYSIPAGATGYFGAQTKAAVILWQKAAGVVPALGYFGPISQAAWGTSSMSTPTTSTSTTSTTLTGSGRFTSESSLGDVTTTLHAGDSATAVVGDSFVATGGDVQLQRVDATFDLSGITTGSKNLDQYASDVELWLGSTKLATMDASAGDVSSSVWTYRFSGLTSVIKKGDTAKIYVKITPLASVSNKQDANGTFAGTMTAKLLADSVRAVSADGISDTYVATAVTQNFTVSSATSGTLTVSPASDTPVASQVMTASSTTTGVKLLAVNLKAKNSDITVTDFKISLNTSDNNLSDVVNTVYLMKGSTVLKSATLSTGSNGTVTFSNVNEVIAQDKTNEYTIVVDLKAENTSYVDGTTLLASTTVAGWTVADGNGNSVTPSAAVAGNTMTLIGTGLSAVLGTPTATTQTSSFSGGQDTATFSIPFTITAGDTAIWVGGNSTATTSTAGRTSSTFATQLGVVYATTTTSTATTTTTTASVSPSNPTTDTTNDSGTNYYVAANSSRTFTLNLSVGTSDKMGASNTVELGYQLVGINYNTGSTMGTTYFTSNISTFKTPDTFLHGH